MSSDGGLLLAFMAFPLVSGGAAGADQSCRRPSLNMANDQESASRRVADRDQPTLLVGMVGISEGRGQRIIEHGDSFVERHVVLLDVPSPSHSKRIAPCSEECSAVCA